MVQNDQIDGQWLGVIGRCLSLLCLHQVGLADKKITEQAAFLEKLGLPVAESAALLGSTERSLKELARRQTKSKKKGAGQRG